MIVPIALTKPRTAWRPGLFLLTRRRHTPRLIERLLNNLLENTFVQLGIWIDGSSALVEIAELLFDH